MIRFGEPQSFDLPIPYALDEHKRLHIGCMECDWVGVCEHFCSPEVCVAGPHEIVKRPIPIRVVPHWAHPYFDKDAMVIWDEHLGPLT